MEENYDKIVQEIYTADENEFEDMTFEELENLRLLFKKTLVDKHKKEFEHLPEQKSALKQYK